MAHEDIAGYGGVDIVVVTNWFIKKLGQAVGCPGKKTGDRLMGKINLTK